MNKKYLFFFAISSFILTVIWILTNIYHSQVTSTIEPVLQTQIIPIEPKFDEETIAELRKRTNIDPANNAVPLVSPSEGPSPTLTPAPTEEAIESLQPTPSVSPEIEEINDDLIQ